VLAEHFERGAEPARAVTWYQRAAEQALAANDFDTALRRAERAVGCAAPVVPDAPARGEGDRERSRRVTTPGSAGAPAARAARTVPEGEAPPERDAPSTNEVLGALRLLQAETHNWRGEFASARDRAREAKGLLSVASDVWFDACGELVVANGRLGNHAELEEIGVELSLRSGRRAGAAQIIASARAAVGLFLAGKNQIGEALLDEIERTGSEVQRREPAVAARVLGARAWCAIMAGDTGRYLELEEATASSYERAGDHRNACLARVNAGYASLELGAYAEAERTLRDALDAAERMGLSSVVATARQNLGMALARQGSLDEARAVELQALEVFETQGHARMQVNTRVALSLIGALAGDPRFAAREAQTAVEAARALPALRAHGLAALARALLDLGRSDEALTAATQAMEILGSLDGIEEGESLIRLSHAEALEATGHRAEARAAFVAAAERLRVRAAKLTDPGWRKGFLERVPDNARTLERARAWSTLPL